MTPTDALIEKNLREQQSADSPLQREVDRRAAIIEKMARAIAMEDGWFGADGFRYLVPSGEALNGYLRKAVAAYSAEHEEEGK